MTGIREKNVFPVPVRIVSSHETYGAAKLSAFGRARSALLGDQDHVVDAAGGLHRRGRGDHRDDDQHRADRRLAGREPEAEDEDERADAAPEAEADAARAHAEGDEADDDEPLERDQDPVGRAHSPVSSRSCSHVLASRRAAASSGSRRLISTIVCAPLASTAPIVRAASVSCSIASSSGLGFVVERVLRLLQLLLGVVRPSRTPARPPPHRPACRGRPRCRSPSTSVSVASTARSRPLRMNPVRPCGVSDCGSSLPAASRVRARARRRRSPRARRARRRRRRRRSAPTRRRGRSRRSRRDRRSRRRRRSRR